MDDKPIQKDTKKIALNGLHMDAMTLRWQGKKYKDMVKELFDKHHQYVLEGRLRTWFAEGGILHEKYKEYSKLQVEEGRELMHQQLRELGMRIPEVLKDTLFMPMRNPFTGEVILDDKKQPVYVRGKVTTEAVKVLAQLLGAKFADDEAGKVTDVLDEYFARVEAMPALPRIGTPAPPVAPPSVTVVHAEEPTKP